jgi:hypothetical protein
MSQTPMVLRQVRQPLRADVGREAYHEHRRRLCQRRRSGGGHRKHNNNPVMPLPPPPLSIVNKPPHAPLTPVGGRVCLLMCFVIFFSFLFGRGWGRERCSFGGKVVYPEPAVLKVKIKN